MTFGSQNIALPYFLGALVLFVFQLGAGLLAAWIYIDPLPLHDSLPFHVTRMLHTSALFFWLLLGFFGTGYYLVPEEANLELYAPQLAYGPLILSLIAGGGTLWGYLTHFYGGREFLEQPVWAQITLSAAIGVFLFQISMTVRKGRMTGIMRVLLVGLWSLALLLLSAFYHPTNLVLDKLYGRLVIHLWFEVTWPLIMAATLGFLMLRLTGVDRKSVEKWLYLIAAATLAAGFLAIGHHYYWIGLPSYWQWIGSVASFFQVLPFFALMLFVFSLFWKGRRSHANEAALLWSLGCATLTFFGAGVWGGLQTLHPVNFYTHGSQITAAHAHLAFFGAYVALILAMITYALPVLYRREPYNQLLNMASFWVMTSGMAIMAFTLTFEGVIQTHLQRVLAEGFMDVQDQLHLFFVIRLGAGILLALGALIFLIAVLVPLPEWPDPERSGDPNY